MYSMIQEDKLKKYRSPLTIVWRHLYSGAVQTNHGGYIEIRQRRLYSSRMQFLTAVSHSIPWVLNQNHL